MSYPKHIYHNDLEREVHKHIEHEDSHPEWYDIYGEDHLLDPDFEDQEFDYDDADY